jgi:glucokinase
MLLAGDIGGTKTDLAIISPERGPRAPLLRAEFPSAGFPSLPALVRAFLATTAYEVDRACFDVAGPVLEGRSTVTNLSWVLDEGELARELGLESVHLLNDLHAIAIAVPTLGADELHTLNPGRPAREGVIAVVAPGTGLGEAFLVWDGVSYRACPSEGGHAGFAPASELEADLLKHLMKRFGHVSRERVCSGLGIPNLYGFLRDQGHATESAELAAALAAASDPTPLIGEAALRRSPPDPLSRAALELFIAILATEAGNFALEVLATGGVYLAGGIPAHILPALGEGGFMRQFVRKGRLTDLLTQIPVHVVLARAALIGSAIRGLELAAAETATAQGRGAARCSLA